MTIINNTIFKQQAQQHRVISIFDKMVLDTETPMTVLHRFQHKEEFVLLEGISEHIKHDRFSYLGFDPHLKMTCFSDHFLITDSNGHDTRHTGNLYDFIKEFLATYSSAQHEGLPYTCGLMGHLSYECVSFLEKVPCPKSRPLDTPYAEFMVPKSVLIFDNYFNTVTLVANTILDSNSTPSSELDRYYNQALERLKDIKRTILSPITAPITPLANELDPSTAESIDYDCNIDKETFLGHVNTCKDYITNGDIFQIQVSRRASMPFDGDPLMLYRYVRNYNPSPFLFYVKFNNAYLIGASPEILVGVEKNKMTIRPLAGTRKRYSKTKTEDQIIEELLADEKEKAEHIMLVDLARHDIGRACQISSVKVTDLMSIEKYRHVMHIVSEVEGTLRPECDAVDAFKYGFPAGTVTGTPKIRAMEIIAELEQQQREFYSGSVVYFDFNGNMKSAITIRSMFLKDNRVYTQAAAGIVADSVPELEFNETEHKMRSCLMAMSQYGKTNSKEVNLL
ncbi:anthranilate synthase component I [Candidatus Marinamargulisbacteria bacterium SCGC AG-410-N11]|nr:anthranilate synthase component I [Candidatus Marinamargulisbacteria bacterium SCGC AG-410-N11]